MLLLLFSLFPTDKNAASLTSGAQCTVPIGASAGTGAVAVNGADKAEATVGITVVVVGTSVKAVGVAGGMAAAAASASAAIEGSHGFIVAHACQVAAWLVSACAL